jgi:hypothetical protein
MLRAHKTDRLLVVGSSPALVSSSVFQASETLRVHV